MTTKEMYEELKQMKKETNWNDLESVRRYNRRARELRRMVEEQRDAQEFADEFVRRQERSGWSCCTNITCCTVL